MLGDAVSTCGNRVAGFAVAPAGATRGLANVRTDDAHRVVNREEQRDRAPLAGLIEHELRGSRSTPSQWTKQLEPPVVFVRRERLPATLVLIPDAPDPIATAELGGHEPRRLVERNDGGPFRGWVAHRVPDGFRWLAIVRCVCDARAEIEYGLTAGHLHPAIWVWSGRGLPRSRELEDAKPWALAQLHHSPLHTKARLLPQDSSQAVG
jgi:hypothetical protein